MFKRDRGYISKPKLIESIRGMQRQQEEAIAELKLKLNEQSQVKDNLVQMNEFTPNVSFSQGLFGQKIDYLCSIVTSLLS